MSDGRSTRMSMVMYGEWRVQCRTSRVEMEVLEVQMETAASGKLTFTSGFTCRFHMRESHAKYRRRNTQMGVA